MQLTRLFGLDVEKVCSRSKLHIVQHSAFISSLDALYVVVPEDLLLVKPGDSDSLVV